jgi:hypothetical protein
MTRTIARRRLTASVAATAGVLAAGVALGVAGPATAASTAGASGTSPSATTAVDPNDGLLRASQMPVADQVEDWAKVARRTGRVSTAQPEPLSSLDATRAARRDFAMPGGSATSVVLTFGSKFDATMAFREVRTWRWHTTDNIPPEGRVLYTGPHVWIPVEKGRGSYFQFVFKDDAAAVEGTFEWLGVTRRGKAVSIVAWRVGGTDATYEVDPTVRSLEIANRKLARVA